MSIIHELHQQPQHIRLIMWGLSSFAVIGVVGYFWLSAVRTELFSGLNPDPTAQAQFAQSQGSGTDLLGAIGHGFGHLVASIGSLIGIESSKGIDSPPQHDTVHMLPLSN